MSSKEIFYFRPPVASRRVLADKKPSSTGGCRYVSIIGARPGAPREGRRDFAAKDFLSNKRHVSAIYNVTDLL